MNRGYTEEVDMFTVPGDPIILPDSFADVPESEYPTHLFPPARQPEDDPSYAGSSRTFATSVNLGPRRSPVSFPLPELQPMTDIEMPTFMLDNHLEATTSTDPAIGAGVAGGEKYQVTLNPQIAHDLDWSADNSSSAGGQSRQVWRPAPRATVNSIDMGLAHGYAQNYALGEGEPTDTDAVVCTTTARMYQHCDHLVQGTIKRKPHCWRCALAQMGTEYLNTGKNGNCELEIPEISSDCPVCKVDHTSPADRYSLAIKQLQDREEAEKARCAKHEQQLIRKADSKSAAAATATVPTTPARQTKRRASSGWWSSQPRKNGRFVRKEDTDE